MEAGRRQSLARTMNDAVIVAALKWVANLSLEISLWRLLYVRIATRLVSGSGRSIENQYKCLIDTYHILWFLLLGSAYIGLWAWQPKSSMFLWLFCISALWRIVENCAVVIWLHSRAEGYHTSTPVRAVVLVRQR